jgi:ABC-type phosphate transport system substrate-binding protein
VSRVAGIAGAAGLTAGLPGAVGAQAGQLNGAGATFPAVLCSRWAEGYFKAAGVQINDQSIGSGGGIKAHQVMTVDFGATDGPMTDQQAAEARGGPTQHITTCLGAVVPTYNLPGITPALRFTGPLLADILLVQNKAGAFPAPTFATVSNAAAGALPTLPDDLRVSITDAEGEQAGPISTFTWVLAYRQQRDRAKGQTLANHLFWAITEGQTFAPDLINAPLPPAILPLVYSKIAGTNFNGQPLLNPPSTLPAPPREVVSTVDNGDGTATTYYSDGTSETHPLG